MKTLPKGVAGKESIDAIWFSFVKLFLKTLNLQGLA